MNLSMPNTIARPGTSRASAAASVPASTTKPAPVTPLAPFEVSIATIRIVINWPEREIDVQRLRDEQRRQRHVDVGAVEVEGIAGRHDEADDLLRAAEPLELRHQRGQRAFRGRRAEHDQQFVLDVAEEARGSRTRRCARSRRARSARTGPRSRRRSGSGSSRLPSADGPYLPIVNAIAPKAPIGATFMMMPMTREHRVRGVVDQAAQARGRARRAASARSRTARRRTAPAGCRRSGTPARRRAGRGRPRAN